MKPLISSCIPTYNRSKLVYDCVTEILKSDYPNIEVVVSDNGSIDKTIELLSEINDTRLKIFRNDLNEGYTKNLIKVCEVSKGEYIFLLSDEDRFRLKKMKSLLNILENKEHSLIITPLVNEPSNVSVSKLIFRKVKYFLKYIYYESSNISCVTKQINILKRGYLSGIIIKRDSLDFLKIKSKQLEYFDFYPQIYMMMMAGNNNSIKIHGKSYIYMNDKFNKSFILDDPDAKTKTAYPHPKSRQTQLLNRLKWILEFEFNSYQKKILFLFSYMSFIKKATKVYSFFLNKNSKESHKIRGSLGFVTKVKVIYNMFIQSDLDNYFGFIERESNIFLDSLNL